MILRPSKLANPDRTTINVAMQILIFLKRHRTAPYEQVRKMVNEKVPGCESLFLPALDLLFLLGVIDYLPKTDAFEYVGPQ